MSIKISFCIPVYNFGEFVGETLDSVICETKEFPGIEIVVFDGGSTDQTKEVLSEYVRCYPQIRYLRQDYRGGIDVDLKSCVDAARGEYCWLLSGDDTLRPGAVAALHEFLTKRSDVYLCGHNQCDFNLGFLYEYPIFRERISSVYNLADSKSRQMYLAKSLNTEACFSFMSGLIVRRDLWLSIEPPEIFKGSCWWHVARLLEHTNQHLSVCYVGETWVNRRGDNDSFRDRGLVRRLGIAINGYHDLSDYYFGNDSIEALHMRRLVRADIKFVLYMHAKVMTRDNPSVENRTDLDHLVRRAYCDKNFSCAVAKIIYLTTPIMGYKLIRAFWYWSRMLFNNLTKIWRRCLAHA